MKQASGPFGVTEGAFFPIFPREKRHTLRERNPTRTAPNQVLRQLLAAKPLDRIRIREVTELCAIRRPSFYDHLPDFYALFHWFPMQKRSTLSAAD